MTNNICIISPVYNEQEYIYIIYILPTNSLLLILKIIYCSIKVLGNNKPIKQQYICNETIAYLL